MSDTEKKSLVEKIVNGALDPLDKWERPIPLPSIGPSHPEVFDRFEEELASFRNTLTQMLKALPQNALAEFSPNSNAPALNAIFDLSGSYSKTAKQLQNLKRKAPHDFAGGWAVEGKEIDLPYWSSFKTVPTESLVFLSLGREPRKANYSKLCTYYGTSAEEDELLYFLEGRKELIADAMGCDLGDADARIDLQEFYIWAKDVKLPIDAGFEHALQQRFEAQADTKDDERSDKQAKLPLAGERSTIENGSFGGRVDRRELYPMAKLLTVIAMEKFGYNPKATRSEVPKKLEGIAALHGLEVSPPTIRKLLKLGAQLLPREFWQEK